MKIFLPLTFVFITSILSAQNRGSDVVYLKNGSIIKGAIINPTDSTIAIRTADGSMFVYNKKEVERTLINNDGGSAKHNNLWMGINAEPQFQNIFKSRKEAQHLLQQSDEDMQLPGSGGVQTGVNLYYLPPGIAGFQTGLQYHYYQSKEIFSQPFNGGAETLNESNSFHNLEIPVLINVRSRNAKVRFYSSDGISAGVTLGARHSESISATGYMSRDTSFTTHADSSAFIYCTILASAGIQISLAQNILLNLAVAFRISSGGVLGATNPFYSPDTYAFIPYSLGLNVEILFRTPDKIKNRNGDFPLPSQKY